MTDLVLINPPCPELTNPHAQVPLGLMYLAATAENAGYDVRICNLAGRKVDVNDWTIPQAKVYGITGTFLHVEAVNALARHLKLTHDCRVIVGGPISLSQDELDFEYIDTLVHGEGEQALLYLLRQPGARIVEGKPSSFDDLSHPARHLWPGPFGGNVFIGGRNYYGGGSCTLMTTRGCPFSCAFCAGPALCSRIVRFNEPGAVVEEMEQVVIDFGVRQFRLSDEFFTTKPSHAINVCKHITASKILGNGNGIAWRASIGVNPHGVDMFKAMYAAGCKEVAFGVESADSDVLAFLVRKGNVDDARTALQNARQAGLETRALMMVGLPGETTKTAKLNIEFIAERLYDQIAVTVFTPVPGCDIANNPDKYNCTIIQERSRRSLCMYSKTGRNDIQPTIIMSHITEREHAAGMIATVEAAENIDVIGDGSG